MRITVEIRRPRWLTPVWLKRARPLVLVLALALAGPVLAADRFSDVPDGPHHNDISAIAAAGITLGCNVEGTLYCPETVVTRAQMGSFLARAAGLGANPPVANADKLDGLDSTAFLSGIEIVTANGNVVVTSGVTTSTGTASCPSGKKVLGGGYELINIFPMTTEPITYYSKPVTGPPQGWTAQIKASSDEDWYVRVHAICANAP